MGYRLGGRIISVLNDFDLSLTKRDGPRGFKRTGTIPSCHYTFSCQNDRKQSRAYVLSLALE
ncbi:hypothetical protein BDR03DRAFT_959480 [Suillus americanus]|nr:hypothetical protein BDR03DRAFT_959480 [Suillus americanus]